MPKTTFLNLSEDKRERIILIAIDEFSSHPFRSASLSRIVARAEIAKGSIYQYFANKLDLYRWLLLDEIPRRKRAWMSQSPPPATADFFGMLEHTLLVSLRFGLAHPRASRMAEFLFETTSDPKLQEINRAAHQLSHDGMTGLVRQGQQDGAIRASLDVDVAAGFLHAVLQQGMSRILMNRFGADLYSLLGDPERVAAFDEAAQRQLAREVIDVLRLGLSGRP